MDFNNDKVLEAISELKRSNSFKFILDNSIGPGISPGHAVTYKTRLLTFDIRVDKKPLTK